MLRERWVSVVMVVTCIIQTQGADKYTDQNRPYEFGFKIGSEQHRHEKKDENGIIMGEFGFLTADGVYHVTVYATDENGNFKILSMKNIRVHPYPSTSERKGHSLPLPPSQNIPQTQGPSSGHPANVAAQAPPSPAKSCSHCSLPTTTTIKPLLTELAVVSRDQPGRQIGSIGSSSPQYPEGSQQINPVANQPTIGSQNYPQDVSVQTKSDFGRDLPQEGNQYDQNYPQRSTEDQGAGGAQGMDGAQGTDGARGAGRAQGAGGAHSVGAPHEYPQQNDLSGFQSPRQTLEAPFSGVVSETGSDGNERRPKQFNDYPQEAIGAQRTNAGQFDPSNINVSQGQDKPVLISARMQIVDQNTDVNHKNPGERDGLPKGLTKDNMLQLLYTFNYTVGFHGHFEEGYTNGAKQGYYYVTGRNGVRTRVDYIADENGFRPKVTQEVLDLLSEDVPKPETEKEAKFGLKGYEFKWLYYPVGSNT